MSATEESADAVREFYAYFCKNNKALYEMIEYIDRDNENFYALIMPDPIQRTSKWLQDKGIDVSNISFVKSDDDTRNAIKNATIQMLSKTKDSAASELEAAICCAWDYVWRPSCTFEGCDQSNFNCNGSHTVEERKAGFRSRSEAAAKRLLAYKK